MRAQNGFGIIEVLIASSIMMVVIFAMTATGRSALRGTTYLHERAQATYLAQEAIEQTRQVRDSYWLDDSNVTNFEEFTNYAVDSSKKWITFYDPTSSTFKIIASDASNNSINIDNLIFTRTLSFAPVTNGDTIMPADGSFSNEARAQNAVKVTVNVEWQSSGQTKSISMSEILTNWRPNY